MSANSSIEWTDRTWNPVRGCSVISPGCVNCYAMKQAHRFSGPGKPYEGLTKLTDRSGPQWTGKINEVRSTLDEPIRWKKPARIFVNSMSDLFHEDVSEDFIDQVWAVMSLTPRHTYQILTKRADRMRALIPKLARRNAPPDGSRWPLPNVWLGVSVENQKYADERIPQLLKTPAAVRFISAEPLLGPVDLQRFMPWRFDTFPQHIDRHGKGHNKGEPNRLDWVIVGGESGPRARDCDTSFIRAIVKQCAEAGVACFVKQLGAHPERPVAGAWNSAQRERMTLSDRKGGDMAEWPEDLRVREFPAVRA